MGRVQPVPHGHHRRERGRQWHHPRMQDALALASQQKAAAAAQDAGQVQGQGRDRPSLIPRKGDPWYFAPTSSSTEDHRRDTWPACPPGSTRRLGDGGQRLGHQRRRRRRRHATASQKAAAMGPRRWGASFLMPPPAWDPAIMGMGPVSASRRALSRAGWMSRTWTWWKINEAFAPGLHGRQQLGLDPARSTSMAAPLRSAIDRRIRRRVLVTLLHEDAATAPEGPRHAVHRRRHGRCSEQ